MTAQGTDRLRIDVLITPEDLLATMASDVREGLTAPQKFLQAKYFYDDLGSELFEKITELPEYYQTRTELAILQGISPALARQYHSHELLELGSGSSKKTTALMDALAEAGTLERFLPIDVSEQILRDSSQTLLERYPGLVVNGVVGDFLRHLSAFPPSREGRLVVFLGSTIGNLNDTERAAFLPQIRDLLQPGDLFLLGVDLVKEVAVIEPAYDDAAGVTAEFNLNILRVVNRVLDGDFDLSAYQHVAFYNREHDRIEMHLRATSAQEIHLRALDLALHMDAGETIWTEISCKFTRERVAAELTSAGLQLVDWYTDPRNYFGLALAGPVTPSA